MTNPGQPDRQVEVDLTASPLGAVPSLKGHGQGIEAEFDMSFFGRLMRFGLRIDDKGAHLADGIRFMVVIVCAIIPTLVAFLVCYVAHTSATVMIGCSLGTGAAVLTAALLTLGLGRGGPIRGRAPLLPYVDQPVLQRRTRKTYKTRKSANRRRTGKPKGRRR